MEPAEIMRAWVRCQESQALRWWQGQMALADWNGWWERQLDVSSGRRKWFADTSFIERFLRRKLHWVVST